MKKPMVSVIVPVYNRAAMVCAAIDSVLAQTYTNFELLVVNDGSTDNTAQVLAGYGPRIGVITQPNQGVAAARNAGIKQAQGQLIAFLDSDDLWLPHKLVAQVDFFAKNSAAMWQQMAEIWVRNGRRVNPKQRHTKLSGRIFGESLKLCLVSPSAVMLQTCLFSEFGLFDETLPACEDYDLWLRILTKYPVYLDENYGIIKHGGHNDQLSKNSALDEFRIQSLSKILHSMPLNPADKAALIKVLRQKCQIYGAGCLKRGKLQQGQYYLNLATTLS